MTNAISAAATGLPSRRAALATFTGAAAALGLLKGPLYAAPATIADPDAVLIALAARTLELNVEFEILADRESTLDGRLMLEGPRRPEKPEAPMPTITIDRQADGSFALQSVEPPAEVVAVYEAAREAHDVAVEAWQAEREAFARRIGLRVVQRVCKVADRRLLDAVEALIAMPATTLKGAVAKARVSAAADPDDSYVLFTELRASVLRDLLAIGGDA